MTNCAGLKDMLYKTPCPNHILAQSALHNILSLPHPAIIWRGKSIKPSNLLPKSIKRVQQHHIIKPNEWPKETCFRIKATMSPKWNNTCTIKGYHMFSFTYYIYHQLIFHQHTLQSTCNALTMNQLNQINTAHVISSIILHESTNIIKMIWITNGSYSNWS